MTYWRSILSETAKKAAADLRVNSRVSIVVAFLIQLAVGIVLLRALGALSGSNLWTRIASFAAPFLLFPAVFIGRLPFTIRAANESVLSEITGLKARIVELVAAGQSDISIYLNLNHTVHLHPDHPLMHSYSVVIENTGANYLTNCVLTLSTANRFNLPLQDRSWLHDASETFDLRCGQVKSLIILWVEAENGGAPAYPQYYHPDQPDFWSRQGGEIIPSDDVYFLFCEVLSANTHPAKLTMRVWNDDNGWNLEALGPGERARFDE